MHIEWSRYRQSFIHLPCRTLEQSRKRISSSKTDPHISMPCVQELLQELWTLILQHVEVNYRLCACALVCQTLGRAAAAATRSLDVNLRGSPQLHDAFLGWARRYGSSLTRLELASGRSHTSIWELACPNLLELRLVECSVQLGVSNQGVGLLHSCPALTRLELSKISLLDGLDLTTVSQPPAAVAQLQSLRLACVYEPAAKMGHRVWQAAQHRILPHLPCLTYLGLVCPDAGSAALCWSFLAQVSTMHDLRQLAIDDAAGEAAQAARTDCNCGNDNERSRFKTQSSA